MYEFHDEFTDYSFFDYFSLAYFYAELVLIDLYVSKIDGQQEGIVPQKYYNRMLLNACLAKLLGGFK